MFDPRTFTLKQLRALAAVVRTGSVTAAAKSLFVTPPAVSAQLKQLERNVGLALLARTGDGLVATDAGREVLRAADEVETRLARLRQELGAIGAGLVGSVSLAVVSTGKYFAPGIVAAFRAEHPGIQVNLAIGNRSAITAGLERGEYDLLLMGYPPDHLEVARDVLGDHPHVVVAPPGHRLVAAEEIRPEDLEGEIFLTREQGSGTRALGETFLARFCGARALHSVEMGTNETIKQAVMAGLGIAFISAHTCAVELGQGSLVLLRVPGLPLVRQWYLVRRSDREPGRGAEALRDFVRARGRGFLPVLP